MLVLLISLSKVDLKVDLSIALKNTFVISTSFVMTSQCPSRQKKVSELLRSANL